MPCKMRVLNLVRGANWGQVSRTLASLKKDLGRHAEQDRRVPGSAERACACRGSAARTGCPGRSRRRPLPCRRSLPLRPRPGWRSYRRAARAHDRRPRSAPRHRHAHRSWRASRSDRRVPSRAAPPRAPRRPARPRCRQAGPGRFRPAEASITSHASLASQSGSHPRAERVLHAEGDHGAVREHDNILRRALGRGPGGACRLSL